MLPDWQRERNALNHDWLKNEFSRHLRAFVVRVGAVEADRMRLMEFITQDWPKWGMNHERVAALLSSAEVQLSPRRLFDKPPLCKCEAAMKVWLPEVVHELWLTRTHIRHLISDAQKALADADGLYQELDPSLRSVESLDPDRLHEVAGVLKRFETHVERLSSCISLLPQKVEVV